ncbi:MAG: hypothetical protein KDJ54_02240 [Candidatus Competibacteraceae bacterium]|nr:hypothetical protein [Candidatus Competibacteraceae bacterium]
MIESGWRGVLAFLAALLACGACHFSRYPHDRAPIPFFECTCLKLSLIFMIAFALLCRNEASPCTMTRRGRFARNVQPKSID